LWWGLKGKNEKKIKIYEMSQRLNARREMIKKQKYVKNKYKTTNIFWLL
jgi:hypothetical protein